MTTDIVVTSITSSIVITSATICIFVAEEYINNYIDIIIEDTYILQTFDPIYIS